MVSAAFDTVDHTILLERLSTGVGLHGGGLKLKTKLYLTRRTQAVSVNGVTSPEVQLKMGGATGLRFGPRLVSVLCIAEVIVNHSLCHHGYACRRHSMLQEIQIQ